VPSDPSSLLSPVFSLRSSIAVSFRALVSALAQVLIQGVGLDVEPKDDVFTILSQDCGMDGLWKVEPIRRESHVRRGAS
jgi:hypothetical protein